MNIRQVTDGKEDYIELLRAGDPDESRIRKLLENCWKKENCSYWKNTESSAHFV